MKRQAQTTEEEGSMTGGSRWQARASDVKRIQAELEGRVAETLTHEGGVCAGEPAFRAARAAIAAIDPWRDDEEAQRLVDTLADRHIVGGPVRTNEAVQLDRIATALEALVEQCKPTTEETA